MNTTDMNEEFELLNYESEDGQISVYDIRKEDGQLWLTDRQIADLFETSRMGVVEHAEQIFENGELAKDDACKTIQQVRLVEGVEEIREKTVYNLAMLQLLASDMHRETVAEAFLKWAEDSSLPPL